ncbi:MAG: cell division protein FtsQ/DivIB [Pseudomonadales bacterium]
MIRNVLAVMVLLALTVSAWSVWRQLDQPLRAVRVQGALSQAEQLAIREVVSQSLTDGVLSVDLAELTTRIRSLSWPRSVQVRRIWPDTLVIQVEKESVVAAWGDSGYLTSAGQVVRLADAAVAVPTLFAVMSTPRQAMEMYQMLETRAHTVGLSIVHLEESALGEWLLGFEGGMTVALGNQAVMERMTRFLLAYERVLAERADDVAHVDARYANGLAVRWAEPLLALGAGSARENENKR